MAGEFEKDFGYLMPFLDKVARAAGSLQDPAARAELTNLMADEKTRWARIRQLLGGATAQATAAGAATGDGKGNPPSVASSAAPEPRSFTVGSLRPKRS